MAVYRLDAYPYIRRLPSHGWSPFRSCLHLVLVPLEGIWYTDLIEIPISHKGLEPHKPMPMTGAPKKCTRVADHPVLDGESLRRNRVISVVNWHVRKTRTSFTLNCR